MPEMTAVSTSVATVIYFTFAKVTGRFFRPARPPRHRGIFCFGPPLRRFFLRHSARSIAARSLSFRYGSKKWYGCEMPQPFFATGIGCFLTGTGLGWSAGFMRANFTGFDRKSRLLMVPMARHST
jgi:hypothetical protein